MSLIKLIIHGVINFLFFAMEYVKNLLKKKIRQKLSVLEDKNWGRHKDDGMELTWRQEMRSEIAQCRKAIKKINCLQQQII